MFSQANVSPKHSKRVKQKTFSPPTEKIAKQNETHRTFTYKLTLSKILKSGCQRKPGKMLKMSTEGGQQNKFILTSWIGLVE